MYGGEYKQSVLPYPVINSVSHLSLSLYIQDKAIAFKIFELGLKKFADEPTYVLAYLDHLSHLNGQHQHVQ